MKRTLPASVPCCGPRRLQRGRVTLLLVLMALISAQGALADNTAPAELTVSLSMGESHRDAVVLRGRAGSLAIRSEAVRLRWHARALGDQLTEMELTLVSDSTGEDQRVRVTVSIEFVGAKYFWDRAFRRRPLRRADGQLRESHEPVFGLGSDESSFFAMIPPTEPLAYEFRATRQSRFVVEFPIALIGSDRESHSWRIALVSTAPDHALRRAWRTYYELYSDHFQSHAPNDGTWLWAGGYEQTNIDNVPRKDMFRHYEIGNMYEFARRKHYDDWAHAADRWDILSYRYIIPGQRELVHAQLTAPGERERDQWGRYGIPQPRRKKVEELFERAGSGNFQPHVLPAEPEQLKRIVRTSGILEPGSGRTSCDSVACLAHQVRGTGWGDDTVTWAMNADPSLGAGSQGMSLLSGAEAFLDAHPSFDGIYVDSVRKWGRFRNVRRAHLQARTWPLSFEAEDGPVYARNKVGLVKFLDELKARLESRGKRIFVNGLDRSTPFAAFRADVVATECSRLDCMSALRFYAYRKPVAITISDVNMIHEQDRLFDFLRRAIAYGVWPSVGRNYFQWSGYYVGRDRETFDRVLSIVRHLNRARWRPIPGVAATHADLVVNQWGGKRSPLIYFTLFNSGEQAFTPQLEWEIDLNEDVRQWSLTTFGADGIVRQTMEDPRLLNGTLSMAPGAVAVVEGRLERSRQEQ